VRVAYRLVRRPHPARGAHRPLPEVEAELGGFGSGGGGLGGELGAAFGVDLALAFDEDL
jgi:hypothetical protein